MASLFYCSIVSWLNYYVGLHFKKNKCKHKTIEPCSNETMKPLNHEAMKI